MSVLLSKNYHSKVEPIDSIVYSRLQINAADTFFYVAPTKRRLRSLQREFLHKIEGGTSEVFQLYTLDTLAAKLYSLVCKGKLLINRSMQSILFADAIISVSDKLQHFRLRKRAKSLPQGTFQKIVDVINHLKEKGVYPAILYDDIETAPRTEKGKLKDILLIYEEYEKFLGENFIDSGGIYKDLNDNWDEKVVEGIFHSNFSKVDTIFISGFDEFSNPELTMLHNLSELKQVGMLVEFDYELDNDFLFSHLQDNYQKLIASGFRKSTQGIPKSEFKSHITKSLFNAVSKTKKKLESENVFVFDATDRYQEIESVAALIKKLIKDNTDFDISKICVAMYQPELYTPIVRGVFKRYVIPANITDRFVLQQSPLVSSVISLLEIYSKSFHIRSIMRALSSPYFELNSSTGLVDRGNIFQVSSKLKIISGYQNWLRRIDNGIGALRNKLIDSEDERNEINVKREIREYEKAKQDIDYIRKLLQRFANKMTPREFKDKLIGLLSEIQIVKGILDVNSIPGLQELIEKDSRAYQKFLLFIDEFLELLAFQGHTEIKEQLDFYIDHFKTAIAAIRYNVRQKYGYGVLVTSLEETRGIPFDYMFIIGLVDGEFPSVYKPEIFFSPKLREKKEKYHLVENRYLFYQVVTNFTKSLFLSWPRRDNSLELVPSPFIGAFENIVSYQIWSDKVLSLHQDTIMTRDELLNRYAQIKIENREQIKQSIQQETTGILEVFEQIDKAEEVETSRFVTDSQSEYNGMIYHELSSSGKEKLNKMRDYVFSVTQLESYGKCPFKYFAERILHLDVVPAIEEGLTPIEHGGVLHRILFEFYIQRRKEKLPYIFSCTESELNEATDMLLTIAKKKLDEMQITDIFWNFDKEKLLGSNTGKGIIHKYIEHEHKYGKTVEVKPAYFEVAFGTKNIDKAYTDSELECDEPIKIGNVNVRGKIDRIDSNDTVLTVVDYKTGSNYPGRIDIENGIALQLPIYLYAIEQIFAKKKSISIIGASALYIILKDKIGTKIGLGNAQYKDIAFSFARSSQQIVESDEELKKLLNVAINYVNQYVEDISQGKFQVMPNEKDDQVCDYCDFGTICRIKLRNP